MIWTATGDTLSGEAFDSLLIPHLSLLTLVNSLGFKLSGLAQGGGHFIYMQYLRCSGLKFVLPTIFYDSLNLKQTLESNEYPNSQENKVYFDIL